ncbi:HPr(Ser) kinase/phosphatase [Flavonifractor sp. An92]|uniref:HPr(Ser) kinase/phosphatase n=1 Tax=Flavonifractor sp. An92 TaxID=1965666 RepID=UPI000B3A6C20|nr:MULTISPECIES: HPr(Ser) kinase/phosphatase [unclassified Flavonifractor]OUN07827.1 HPr(Ser) kinase/phosphatase [Flavonifractor sp. An92]OUQ22537.1 HPr(Ser) kinase/phosphatase [Flavonifractor sp. An135]
MSNHYGVKLSKLIDEFGLEVLRGAKNYQERVIATEDVNRPGLQLTGFFDYFDPERLQVIGLVEITYLSGLSEEERRRRFQMLLEQEIPALIIARGMEPFPECMELAEQYDRTILRCNIPTTEFISNIVTSLHNHLAPRITRHGVLVEVYGEGVLLMGDSGVGKSETAIELVKRGHRLIADDAVEIRRLNNRDLVGTAPELIRHYMELRGIGVVDVRRLFGMSAVKEESNIDMIINLEPWREDAVYDRLGVEENFMKVLEVDVPVTTVPVKPGRNLAVIIEVAAMNNRHKKMGYNSALEFTKQIDSHFDQALNGNG